MEVFWGCAFVWCLFLCQTGSLVGPLKLQPEYFLCTWNCWSCLRSLSWWLNLKRKPWVWCLDSRAVEGHVTNTTRRALRHPDRHIFPPKMQLSSIQALRTQNLYCWLLSSFLVFGKSETIKHGIVHVESFSKKSIKIWIKVRKFIQSNGFPRGKKLKIRLYLLLL